MSEKTFILSIHHWGRFVDDSRRRYVGGKVTQVCDALDIDKISYPEIISYVKEDLQYELELIDGLYYHKQGNFVLVKDDQAILSIVSELYKKTKLEFYVKHKNLAKEVTLSKQTEVIDRGVNQGVDLSDDNGSEDELLQQTFDNLNKDIAFLTDDDDEEVQMSRKNIRSFKEKNTFNGDDNTRSDDELDAYVDDIICDSQEDDAQEEEDDELEEGNDSDGSFYYDSDDCCSYYSESDEESGDHALRKPSEMVRFDPMATIPVFLLWHDIPKCSRVSRCTCKLREMNLLGNGILEDFMQYNVESFSKAYFRTTPKCDYVDNNMAETFNGWILDARCKPIISMLEDIRVQVMRRLYAKRKFCTTWICVVGPRPMQKLERNKELSFKWQMVWNGDEGYEVSNVYDQDNRHIVNLKSSSCTCREWELTGIPCQHAVCVLHSEGLEPENFVAHWYIESTYLKANQFMIQPVRGKILWAETGKEEIAPPAHRKLPGRPKVRRKKDKNEIQKAGKLSRKGRIMTCKICKQPGHNIRRCPQKMNMPEEDNVRSLEQYATNKSLSQSRNEMRDEQSLKRHNGSIQLGKRSRTTKSRMTKGSTNHPTGYGLYINENTGQAILNPGIRSNKYVKTHQETMFSRPSEDTNKDVPGSKNQTTAS
ncbi:hypothetical protein SASPL_140461 [Salvia splendens]|uniref:SWIM-type domain-containing protein n=1 Tax=Salvia splendens TaxID=180675 RepID=A0A8X8WQS9_SALSN|nr:hypothetical protein SASPL_140461 [Salvia splendens]